MKQNCYRKTRPFWVRFALLLVFLVHWSCSDDKDFEGNPGPGTGEVPEQTRYLPLIEITTSETIVDEPKMRSNMKITVDEEVDYDGIAGIEIRGASSQMFDKKSYGLETWDDNNEDINVSLLGMPEEEDWVLHGPFAPAPAARTVSIDLTSDIARSITMIFDVDRTPDFTHDVVRSFTVITDRKNA